MQSYFLHYDPYPLPANWGTDKPDHPVSAQPFGTLPWMPA